MFANTTTAGLSRGQRGRTGGLRASVVITMPWLATVLCALLLLQAGPAHAFRKITEEEGAFREATVELLKNAVAQAYLGRHGELIVPDFTYAGDGGMGCVNILKDDNGSYTLTVFAYPKRYYYGRITPSCDIVYSFDAGLPPGVDGTAFAGPLRWPFSDKEGRPCFQRPDKVTVIANRKAFPTPKVTNRPVRGVAYACADNAFYLFKGTEVLSPFPLFLVENSEKKCLDLVPPNDVDHPYLSIIDGGWADSHILFKRNADHSLLEPEIRVPWPYHNDDGKPALPDPSERLRVGQHVTDVLFLYDTTGKNRALVPAPRP